MNTGAMGPQERHWITRLGQFGHAALAVVFTVIGVCLITAAVHPQPPYARGLGGALAELAAQPAGPWSLGLVAIGLVAYGAFALTEARYRRMSLR